MRVGKTFTFDAAHRLPEYDGKCQNLHGHTYTVEIVLAGCVRDGGMVLDFSRLKDIVDARVISVLDHAYLNDVPGLKVPTAENICSWIWVQLHACKELRFKLRSVKVWETPTSYAMTTGGV